MRLKGKTATGAPAGAPIYGTLGRKGSDRS